MIGVRQRFTPLQRLLHWLMAVCILAMLFIGVGMVSTVTPKFLPLVAIHKSLGIAILVLALIRLAVRLRYGAPALPADLPEPMKLAAYLSHYALYALMIGMPLIGWAMLSAAAYPVVVFGGVYLPAILPQSDFLHAWLWDAHFYLAFAFFGLVLMHVAAALFHALVRRDGVFEAMASVSIHDDKGGKTMKIVVIGGTGLIGSKTVAILRQGGHEVVAASPNSGVNTITGEGVKEAVAGAQVVIDLANSPSFEDKAVLEFFETAGRNLLPAEAAAGVRHHVALSIVGIDRSDSGYFRAKVAQEKLIKASGIPYTIIRSTQFLEFLRAIAAESTDGNVVRLSPGLFQPIAADDVAAHVADVALAPPRNSIVEIAGPERAPFNEIVARYLKAVGDSRQVVSDPEARYFGGRVEELSLVPLGEARLGRIGLDEWLRRSQVQA